MNRPCREHLPDDRQAVTRKLTLRVPGEDDVQEITVYATVGLYPDGRVAELFLKVARQGSTISGFADAVAMCISIGLQYGVPLEAFVSKLRHQRFEPVGRTGDPEQPAASSLLDLVAGWLERRFGRKEPTDGR